ncbi:hypothetical protein KXV92_003313 [Aspergillus fumigatus]|nr:hypothetical protein KXX42_009116 [Aspergillus fumigatus]KAH1987481.1 hypothetical protein KXW88_002793 [Aspergillus fumigatus]KAH2320116.1 hypothetical protein KXV47_002459 [Aspergillus fumigatus]KAH2771462.1 hypothetical protein KXV94_003511 [Aspergillus fumigatus]KAH3150546.1 hypothetical protein KXW18_000003 [Aspergillus fumigatus]
MRQEKQDKSSIPYAWYWHGKPLRTGLAQGEKIRPVSISPTNNPIHADMDMATTQKTTTGSQSHRSRTQTPTLLECNNQGLAVRKGNRVRSPAVPPRLSPVKAVHATLPAQSPAL